MAVGLGPAVVLLRESGSYHSSVRRRRWGFRGRFLRHLIDSRTRAPAEAQAEVSMVAASIATAEVLVKTVLLLGRGADAYLDRRPRPGWWHRLRRSGPPGGGGCLRRCLGAAA